LGLHTPEQQSALALHDPFVGTQHVPPMHVDPKQQSDAPSAQAPPIWVQAQRPVWSQTPEQHSVPELQVAMYLLQHLFAVQFAS
jgi:hypothetical protein